jgi:hypothetical protein
MLRNISAGLLSGILTTVQRAMRRHLDSNPESGIVVPMSRELTGATTASAVWSATLTTAPSTAVPDGTYTVNATVNPLKTAMQTVTSLAPQA